MKLGDPFRLLMNNVNKIEGSIPEFQLKRQNEDRIVLDFDKLQKGVEITLDKLENPDRRGGLLSINGHQVLLYIPDQGSKFDSVLQNSIEGKRVHIADCSTLDYMRLKNRFHQRYVATNDITEIYDIFEITENGKKIARSKLHVCKNCLKRINYRGYRIGRNRKHKIFSEFNMAEFFSEYSSVFKELPKSHNNRILEDFIEYDESKRREHIIQSNTTCESCKANLNRNDDLFEIIRRQPAGDLALMCVDCLRQPPYAHPINIPRRSMTKLTSLRKKQKLIQEGWSEIMRYADPACIGLLSGYQKLDWSIPELGYDITGVDGSVVTTVELAWPNLNPPQAVCLNEESAARANEHGWSVFTLDQALRELDQDGL